MPSFFIRGLARYFAASAMEHKTSHNSYNYDSTPTTNHSVLSEADLCVWKTDMRWLLPFVQATGYHVVIENPKSHEQIEIDQNTKDLPDLSLRWMQNYNEQEVIKWLEQDKLREQQEYEQKDKKNQARLIAEERGRAKFGNSYKPTEEDVLEVLKKL